MSLFSTEELARRDFLIALGIWLSLEFVAFVIFPALRLINPGDRMVGWFWTSIPLGIGGALLLGLSSRFVAISNELRDPQKRRARIFLAQVASWVGLVGIAFPLLMISLEFFSVVMNDFAKEP